MDSSYLTKIWIKLAWQTVQYQLTGSVENGSSVSTDTFFSMEHIPVCRLKDHLESPL